MTSPETPAASDRSRRGHPRWPGRLLGWSLILIACSGAGNPGDGIERSTSAPGPARSSSTSPHATGEGQANALVTRVVDGDTIEVRYQQQDLTVRLIGIDTPESVMPGEPVQCYALAASRFTTNRLDGANVRLEFDVERTDKYGRTLAYVWLGRELFNETLVRQGYAFVTTYPPDVKYESVFLDAQRRARAESRGVWGRCVEPSQDTCDPAYPGVCIAPPPPDLDCSDIPLRHFAVEPPDPHNFDSDGNGIGCESG